MIIKDITYEQCLPLWEQLWANRVSRIDRSSCMALPPKHMLEGKNDIVSTRLYSKEAVLNVTYLGLFDGDKLVGVNSFHQITKMTRSRGLYVLPEYRGRGYGIHLLEVTWEQSVYKPVWSYPKLEALSTYAKAGFEVVSKLIYDPIENKTNCYVVRE